VGKRGDARIEHRWGLAVSWIKTLVMLRFFPLRWIVSRVQARNQRHVSENELVQQEELKKLIGIYYALQPGYFASDDACLRNSILMLEFLARFRIYPSLVFGVTIQPFSAHSWVQYRAAVLNDSVHNVETYVPLLVA
jgi:hypothetical protein